MAELLVLRHGQAAFGSDNYDRLSDLGQAQARATGDYLRATGWVPDRMITGSLARQKATLAAMGFDGPAEEHAGFNEYDFHDLLAVRHGGTMPEAVKSDRKTHFRALRETLLEWQSGGLPQAAETWIQFQNRVAAARSFACSGSAERVLVVSSGGAIAQMVAAALAAPAAQMIALNLQVKNAAMTRFIFAPGRCFLHEFNSTPQFALPETAAMLSYS